MASGGLSARSLPLPLLLLVVLLLSGHTCSHVGALTVDDLYPFGADNGDTIILGGDDVSSDLIALPYPVPVFGISSLSGAYVNLNGAVHFRSRNNQYSPDVFPLAGDEYSMVAPFWADLWASCAACTGMGFRAVDDAALLADITSDIRGAFPNDALATSFTAESALIATWINVTLYAIRFFPNAEVHTFQAVIAFNTRTVFVGLLLPDLTYPDLGAAEAGFNLGDGERSFRLPTSYSNASFDELSNVGQAGKWWFGLDEISKANVGTFAYIDEPDATSLCTDAIVYGDAGLDTCGDPRVMDWDFNDDGAFDDVTDTTVPVINTALLRLTTGVHPIRARVSSPSTCPGATNDPLVVSTTLVVFSIFPPLRIISVKSAATLTGNPRPYAGEDVRVSLLTDGLIYCNVDNITIDCGDGAIAESQPDCQARLVCLEGTCRYSSPGNYTITATITQNGVSASGTRNITVVEYKQACSPQEYPPNGRAVGRRGCIPYQWTYATYRCNYPVTTAGIKPYTPLWAAFASRDPQDAAVIRRFYGNRTMAETLTRNNNQLDYFGREAAAALLNALTLPYPQCPSNVKAKFRHALYHGVNSDEAQTVYNLFLSQNDRGYNGGCTLPVCAL